MLFRRTPSSRARRTRLVDATEKLTRFVLNRAGLASRWLEIGRTRLHVYDGRGKGKLPTVVLLHGLSASASTYAALVAGLLPHVRRIVVPELPGHGFTAHPGDPVTPDVLEATVVEALDALLEEPAIVVGNSLGGALALHYAVTRPEKVRGLVLLSPAGARLPDGGWDDVRQAFRIASRREAMALIHRIYHRPRFIVAMLAHEFPSLMSRPAVVEILATATNDHAITPDELGALRMPILFLWGRSERLLPHAALEYFRTHLPAHAEIEQPEGLGHVPQVDAPERIAARILSFARACESSRPVDGGVRAGTHAPTEA